MLEKLVGAIRAQQYTIEVLTVKFEEANAKLKKANARIAELEEQLHKNSHNSSKPPSYDDCEKSAPKSQRKMSGKKACSQTICKGHHMMLAPPTVSNRYIRSTVFGYTREKFAVLQIILSYPLQTAMPSAICV